MTVVYLGIRIDVGTVRECIMTSCNQLFMAKDVAWRMGFREVDSYHPAYRPVLRALNRLHENGEIGKFYIREGNISVFFKKQLAYQGDNE